jgi:hypothetical protein
MDGGIEAVRASYRPKWIKTLFVGESAPHSGKFFYIGDTAMLRYMRRAVDLALGESDDFLESFKVYGWYLDDLVLTPVNKMAKPERKAKCLGARKSLADRIVEYQPEAIVSLLLFIKPFVDEAAKIASCDVPRYAVPFPGMGQQARFQTAMASLIPKLLKL